MCKANGQRTCRLLWTKKLDGWTGFLKAHINVGVGFRKLKRGCHEPGALTKSFENGMRR